MNFMFSKHVFVLLIFIVAYTECKYYQFVSSSFPSDVTIKFIFIFRCAISLDSRIHFNSKSIHSPQSICNRIVIIRLNEMLIFNLIRSRPKCIIIIILSFHFDYAGTIHGGLLNLESNKGDGVFHQFMCLLIFLLWLTTYVSQCFHTCFC